MGTVLRFVDETLRDGQQSLWATRMKTESMLPIAPVMNEAGFHHVCVMAPVSFETCIMYLHEDPFERLRLLRRLMPNTMLEFQIRSRNVIGWRRMSNDVIELLFETLRKYGVDCIKVFDGLNDLRNLEWHMKVGRELGFYVMGIVVFAESPVHTDGYFLDKIRRFVELGADGVVLLDASGVMRPERARVLCGAAREILQGKDFYFSAHDNTGLALACYREAIRQGVDAVWTVARPLAYGPSLPATRDVIGLAGELGREVTLDHQKVWEIDDWFYWVAYKEGKRVGHPVRYDPQYYASYVGHQIPGGMITNLEKQLSDLGLVQRLPEVLEEAARVRAEIGYPVMVTPFSQFVGVQATLNVIEGERYRTVPHELRLYARGYYGEIPGPMDPDVRDKLVDGLPPLDPAEIFEEPIVRRVISEEGPFESDEDLLLHIFFSRHVLERYRQNRKIISMDPCARIPLATLVKELVKRGNIKTICVEKSSVKILLSGGEVTRRKCGNGF